MDTSNLEYRIPRALSSGSPFGRPDDRLPRDPLVGGGYGGKQTYFATKPASVISEAFSLSSSSRNFSMSWPVRKIGFSACFSI